MMRGSLQVLQQGGEGPTSAAFFATAAAAADTLALSIATIGLVGDVGGFSGAHGTGGHHLISHHLLSPMVQ